MSVSLWGTNKDKEKKNYDVVIIGGGISGLSTAYWLTKYEGMKIAIVEKYKLGAGATGRNAGFITCGSVEHFNKMVKTHGLEESLATWKFSEENLELLKKEIIKDKDLGFEQNGSFSIATEKNDFENLKESAKIMKENGINVEILEEIDVKSRLGIDKFIGGIKYLDDATVDPILLLKEMQNLIKDKVDIYENHEVISVEGTTVLTNETDFEADAVVYALNGYSELLDKYFKNKIIGTKAQIVATEKTESFMEGACYANSFMDYFRQAKSGEFVIGGFRQEDATGDMFSDVINEKVDEKLEWFIREYLPKLKDVKITHRWSGTMGWTHDGKPLVGTLPTNQNVFFLGGYTGHGLGLAFNCANKLVKMMMEGESLPDFISARR